MELRDMETLCGLLFELSSTERLNILLELQGKEHKLSQLSKDLDLTVSETSRHFQRLSEVGLVQKESDGLYKVTPTE
jgi:predicted transcriptional regulator